VLGLDYEGGDGIMTGSLAAGVRLQPQASDLLGPQAASRAGVGTPGTTVSGSPLPINSPAVLQGLARGETVASFPGNVSGPVGGASLGVALADPDQAMSDPPAVPSVLPSILLPGNNGAPPPAGLPGGAGLPPGSDPRAQGLVMEWAGRSAFGFRAGSPGGDQPGAAGAPSADAVGSGEDISTWEDDTSGVDLFFSRLDGE
jgi:hypothetical protein